jgi:hypothetical protein
MSKRLLTVAVLAFLTISVVIGAEGGATKAAPFVHTVIFTVKADAPAGEADELLADCQELLAKIPSVRTLRAGRPAKPAAGKAKSDYSVGLMILFDDAAGLAAYDVHPNHKKFVEKHIKHIDVEKLSVFDFPNETK